MYPIRKVEPVNHDKRKTEKTETFPFNKLEVGEGFYVPNKLNMPPAEDIKAAHSLQNMQTHCNYRNRKADTKVFRAALYPADPHWIQVWRES